MESRRPWEMHIQSVEDLPLVLATTFTIPNEIPAYVYKLWRREIKDIQRNRPTDKGSQVACRIAEKLIRFANLSCRVWEDEQTEPPPPLAEALSKTAITKSEVNIGFTPTVRLLKFRGGGWVKPATDGGRRLELLWSQDWSLGLLRSPPMPVEGMTCDGERWFTAFEGKMKLLSSTQDITPTQGILVPKYLLIDLSAQANYKTDVVFMDKWGLSGFKAVHELCKTVEGGNVIDISHCTLISLAIDICNLIQQDKNALILIYAFGNGCGTIKIGEQEFTTAKLCACVYHYLINQRLIDALINGKWRLFIAASGSGLPKNNDFPWMEQFARCRGCRHAIQPAITAHDGKLTLVFCGPLITDCIKEGCYSCVFAGKASNDREWARIGFPISVSTLLAQMTPSYHAAKDMKPVTAFQSAHGEDATLLLVNLKRKPDLKVLGDDLGTLAAWWNFVVTWTRSAMKRNRIGPALH